MQTKHAAEAVLRELPSVVGACVREDVNGHPREVHLLVRGVTDVRGLAHDVRDLLEERLEIPIDQRIISIAQLSESPAPAPRPRLRIEPDTDADAGTGTDAAPAEAETRASAQARDLDGDDSAAPGASSGTAAAGDSPGAAASFDASAAGASSGAVAAGASGAAAAGSSGAAAGAAAGAAPSNRLIYDGLETHARDARVSVRVRLSRGGTEYVGEAVELDAGHGRVRAAALAVLRAAIEACGDATRLELESAAVARAFERDYVLVTVLALAPWLGRRPVPLIGAHPVDEDVATSAVLAVLKATNRVLGRSIEARAG